MAAKRNTRQPKSNYSTADANWGSPGNLAWMEKHCVPTDSPLRRTDLLDRFDVDAYQKHVYDFETRRRQVDSQK